jgi:isoquinoline 1-oxidoreductase beta subunit
MPLVSALRHRAEFQTVPLPNFDTYEIMRLAEMPKVETVIVPSYDFWGGVGEPTICVVTPAVLNAIAAATGKPVRTLPLKNVRLV